MSKWSWHRSRWAQATRARANEKLLAGLQGGAGVLSADPQKRVAAYRAQHPDYADLEVGFAGPTSKTWRLTSALASSQQPNGSTISGRCSWRMLMFSPWPRGWRRDSVCRRRGDHSSAQVPGSFRWQRGFVQATGDALLARIAVRPKTGFGLPVGRWLPDAACRIRPSCGHVL